MEQDNVIGGEWREIFDRYFSLNQVRTKETRELLLLVKHWISEEFDDRIKSLSAANAFHKQAAHQAIQEQNRLQKKLEELMNEYMQVQVQPEINQK